MKSIILTGALISLALACQPAIADNQNTAQVESDTN